MSNKNKKTIVLLDSHAILHRAYHALPDFKSSKGEPTGAIYGFCTFLLKMIKDLKPDYVIACYDLKEKTHRHEVYENYKAGRAKIDDELIVQLESSKKFCEAFNIPIYSSVGFEADDMLGTIVDQTKNDESINIVIASGDMDTMQLINKEKVVVYTLKKGIKDTVIYNEDAVLERFGFKPELLTDFKGLRGDPSDNIIGIKGIGEKTAEVLIQNYGSLENIYKELKKPDSKIRELVKPRIVELLENGEDEALFSKTLATIRRDAPIVFKLPEKRWIESVDQEKVVAILNELDFRSLKPKIAEVFNFQSSDVEIEVSQKDLNELQIMYWILDSDKSQASIDEIFSFLKVEDVKQAKEKLEFMIKNQKLDFVWQNIEKPLMDISFKMTEKGILVDLDFFRELSSKYHKILANIEKQIFEISGVEFNIASPKQLGEVLFEKLGLKIKGQKKNKSGGFSTKESELLKLKDEHPIINLILSHREYAKLLSTYIDTIPTLVKEDQRLHPTFLQAGTTTGRMSSENPNIQNIPNKTEEGREIRKAFICQKGFKLVSFDYSQIELRIAGFLSGDKKLIDIFNKNEDIHKAVASYMFKVPISEVTKQMRSSAKTINFGVMYGMGVLALKQNLNIPKEEAQEFLNSYFNTFSGLSEYLEDIKQKTRQLGFTETFFGRRRYFKDINSKLPFLKAQAERMAINAPIQGTEADIIKLAMVKIDEYIKANKLEDKVFILLQVHDELVLEINETVLSKVSLDIKKIMESVINPKDISGIVCLTNTSVGANWGEMETII
jgi:DNA polymerase-1